MGKKTNRRTTEDAGDSGARARTPPPPPTTTTTTTTRARFSTPVVVMVERVEDATMPTTLDADYVVVRAEEAASAIRAHALACYDVAFASMVEVDGEASPERVLAAFARESGVGETSARGGRRREMRETMETPMETVRRGGAVRPNRRARGDESDDSTGGGSRVGVVG